MSMEDEKLAKIRQNVREVILPLLQRIYDEDPSDINSFCMHYFEGLHKQSQNNDADEKTFAQSDKQCITVRDADRDEGENKVKEISKASLQGSASLPTISDNKNAANLKLRETSSWNQPPKTSQPKGRRSVQFNLLDEASKIGDQPMLELQDSDMKEECIDANVGDACLSKKDAKFENGSATSVAETLISAQQNFMYDRNSSPVFPSAPPSEMNPRNMPDVCPESLNGESHCILGDGNFNADELPDSHSVEGFSDEKRLEAESMFEKKNLICKGQLSPNSSFGFIPDIKDGNFEENETKNIYRTGEETPDSIQAGKCDSNEIMMNAAEAFNDLAEETDSAETDLHSRFLKAKETSDDMEKENAAKVVAESNGERTLEALDSVKKVTFSQVLETVLPTGGIRGFEVREKDFEYNHKQEPQNLETEKAEAREDRIATGKNEVDKIADKIHADSAREAIKLIPEFIPNASNGNESDFQRDVKTESQSSRSGSDIDELWMQRWYEVHPRLHDITPTFNMAYEPDLGHRSNKHGINEAGDVPGHRRIQVQDNSRSARTESYSESKLSTYLTLSSANFDNAQGSFSADEIYHRTNSGRVACNFYGGSNSSEGGNAPESNKPYTWKEWAASRLGQVRPRDTVSKSKEENSSGAEKKYGTECKVELSKNCKLEKDEKLNDEFTLSAGRQCSSCNCSKSGRSDNPGSTKPEQEVGDLTNSEDSSRLITSDVRPTFNIDNSIPYFKTQFETILESTVNSDESYYDGNPNAYSFSYESDSEIEPRNESNADGRSVDNRGSIPQIVAGPEKIEPGLNSAGGDVATADGPEGLNAEEPEVHLTDSTEDPVTPNADQITAEYFEEVMRDFINEEEMLSSEYRVLELEMCSESDLSNTESADEC